MRIAGLQKLTLLDFPGKTAATVFTPGCNFRCPFCHNADLVTGEAGRDGAAADSSALSIDELFAFLGKRQGLLDGVCITGLVDYVATDVKNAPERYAETVGVPAFDLAPVQESLDFLRSGAVPYEVRTTVVRELHTADDLRALAAWIEGVQAWHLQSFIDADSVLGGEGRFHAWDPDDLRALLPELQAVVPGAQLRGVD